MARSSGPTVTRWAISPDRPWCPRRTWPSLTRAQPRPSPRWRKAKSARAPCPAWVCSARAAQFTSLSVSTGPLDEGGEDVGGGELADQERRVGQVDEPPGDAVDGVGGADDGEVGAPGGSRAPVRSASATCAGSVGRGSVPLDPPHGVPVHVDGFDDDGRRTRCRRPAQCRDRRPARSSCRCAPRPVVRSPVSRNSPTSVSLRALSRAVGLDRPVWVAISARVRRGWSISARRTCSSVSDRSSLQRRLRRGHTTNSSKESCLTARRGLPCTSKES